MTKREIEKCENLMHEAIRYAKESKEELEKAMSEKDKTEREILHSKGVQHYTPCLQTPEDRETGRKI